MRETSPDEHQKNLERILNATSGKELGTYIVQPLLYAARQDRKNGLNESLDMAVALDNIKNISRKFEGFITIDPHNPAALETALSGYDCPYLFPTVPTLRQVVQDITAEELHNIIVIGPDA
ncbi:MAG: hypothetical protein LBI53_04775 [Candidatus Peribacteria bacterium]|jgi:phosphoribosylpyrophosphate synthetase|nr:hypothetical protein [Candidatus Peribacteria bacterium]